jgi:hypothetical protein
MSRAGFSLALAGTTLGIAVFASTATAQSDETGGVLLPAKLDAEGASQMLIPISVQGHIFWCNADSGGSRALSLDLAKALDAGLQPNATGTNAGVGPDVSRDQRVRGVAVEVGPIVLQDITIVLVPRPTVVPDIDCVLGLGLLPEFAIEFDYLTPAVRLIPATRFRPAATAIAIPIAIDRNATPSTKARLQIGTADNVDVTLMVDTGASYYDLVLLKPFIDTNHLMNRIGTMVPRFSDTPGMAITATRTTTLSVGPFEISGPVAALISTGSGGTFSVDGLLGTGFLRRFKVTFDYSHQQIWLEPNGRPRGPQVFDASGIEVRPTEAHEFAIVAVAPDSPATEANLRVGDVLKEIDGRRTRDMTLGDIQDAFSRAGVTCTVQMERGTHVDKTTLQLRRRL